jgi:hypothetical protein
LDRKAVRRELPSRPFDVVSGDEKMQKNPDKTKMDR